jgi:hypothetical protein
MAYLRGENYIWGDGERVHLWAADGLDNWQDSVWLEGVRSEVRERENQAGPSGVALSRDVADLYVVMRFAELVQERRVREIGERAVSAYGANTGCLTLRGLAPELLRSVEALTAPDEQR